MGTDPSLSGFRQDWQILDKDDPDSVSWDYKKKYRDSKPILRPEAFHTGEDYVKNANLQFNF